jgi:hypothetical protein
MTAAPGLDPQAVRRARAVCRGSASGSMIFSCPMTEPGHPCVTISGSGPARAIRQVSFASFAPDQATRVAFDSQWRAPLLLIASGKDQIFPATATKASFQRYRQSAVVTACKEFP